MRSSKVFVTLVSRLVFHILLFVIGIFIAALLALIIEPFLYVCFMASFGILSLCVIFNKTNIFQRLGIQSIESRFLNILVASLILFSFLTSFPLTIDRSFSVWMISRVYQESERGITLTRSDLERIAESFFSPENGEINRRIKEQIRVGNLRIQNSDEVSLTGQGKFSVQFFRLISTLFTLNPKYVDKG